MGFGDALTAKISGPLSNGDGKKLRKLIWEAILTFTILFTVIVLLPGIFSGKIFGLMKVHTDIQSDIFHMILLSLPSMLISGIADVLKMILVNFGKTRLIGRFAILTSLCAIITTFILIIVLKWGFWGV